MITTAKSLSAKEYAKLRGVSPQAVSEVARKYEGKAEFQSLPGVERFERVGNGWVFYCSQNWINKKSSS